MNILHSFSNDKKQHHQNGEQYSSLKRFFLMKYNGQDYMEMNYHHSNYASYDQHPFQQILPNGNTLKLKQRYILGLNFQNDPRQIPQQHIVSHLKSATSAAGHQILQLFSCIKGNSLLFHEYGPRNSKH